MDKNNEREDKKGEKYTNKKSHKQKIRMTKV